MPLSFSRSRGDVDVVALLDRELAAGTGELLDRDLAFGLVADVDDRELGITPNDGPLDWTT